MILKDHGNALKTEEELFLFLRAIISTVQLEDLIFQIGINTNGIPK